MPVYSILPVGPGQMDDDTKVNEASLILQILRKAISTAPLDSETIEEIPSFSMSRVF